MRLNLFTQAKKRSAAQITAVACLCANVLFWASPSFSAAIYKTVDAEGNVVFTDQPVNGAEPQNSAASQQAENAQAKALKEAQALESLPLQKLGSQPDPRTRGESSDDDNLVQQAPTPIDPPPQNQAPEPPEPGPPVFRVEIITPLDNTTLYNPVRPVWVELQSYPTRMKKSGLTAQLWVNDTLIREGRRPMLSMPAPERGSHVLQIRLVDEEGRLHLASEIVNLHVKRTTPKNINKASR